MERPSIKKDLQMHAINIVLIKIHDLRMYCRRLFEDRVQSGIY